MTSRGRTHGALLFAWWFLMIYGNGQPLKFGPLSGPSLCDRARQNVIGMTKHPAFGATGVRVEACHSDTFSCPDSGFTPHYFATFVEGTGTILGPYAGATRCERAYEELIDSWTRLEPTPRHNFGVRCWPAC